MLLGYDMSHGPKGQRHNHGNHPRGLGNFGMPGMCARAFPALARDLAAARITVIKASE